MALRKLFRDTALITTLIGGFFLLFSLQALLSDFSLTGNVIQIGKPNTVIITPPDDGIKPTVEQPAPDPKTQCWKARGLRDEDFVIVGTLLRNAPCAPDRGQQPITATKQDGCIKVAIGTEGTTTLCADDDQQPSFSIGFLPPPAQQQPSLPAATRSYGLALFIFLLSMGFLLLWGRVDLQYALYRSRTSKRYDKLLSGKEEVAIRYIAPPPRYVHKQAGEKITVHLPPTHQPAPVTIATTVEKKELLKEQPQSRPSPLATALNRALIRFNTLSQELCDLVAAKQFTQAEQQYPQLYRLALDLYPQVHDENKKRLMNVVRTLHGQLKDLRKAYSVAQDVRQQYHFVQQQQQQPEPLYQPRVWEPAKIMLKKEQVRHLDEELTKLRHLLEQGQHPTLVQQFKKRLWH